MIRIIWGDVPCFVFFPVFHRGIFPIIIHGPSPIGETPGFTPHPPRILGPRVHDVHEDLSDRSQQVRASALRAMASIKVLEVRYRDLFGDDWIAGVVLFQSSIDYQYNIYIYNYIYVYIHMSSSIFRYKTRTGHDDTKSDVQLDCKFKCQTSHRWVFLPLSITKVIQTKP